MIPTAGLEKYPSCVITPRQEEHPIIGMPGNAAFNIEDKS
ncbi:Uncharacterised protein [Vibrio cholerae]|nr:Uncharacterised protein [Vibrio cholerae]CSI52904.1 Uncharacterised protein [Vibrio cholerae]CSI77302.1 Uncharacterised protein [Vibrio cholerae]